MKARAAEAGGIEPAELGFADSHRHERDADIGALACRQRVLGHRIVEAVRVRLHDDAALDAEQRMQREELLLRCVAGREPTVRREGEAVLRPEHVDVRVAGAGR